MVERNPYETNTPVDVPHFMSQEQPAKQKENIDMSVFKLKEEELRSDKEPVKRKAKRKANTNNIFGLVSIVLVLALIITVFLLISKNKQLNAIQSEYETFKTAAESKIDRLTADNETVTKELEELKATIVVPEEPEEVQETEETTETKPSGGTTSLKAGTYTCTSSPYIRSGAGSNNDVVEFDDLPQKIQWIANANSTVVIGQQITISEIKVVSDTVWGKLADNCWVCIKNGNAVYVE